MEQHESLLREAAGQLRGSPDEVPEKVRDALERVRQMEREIRALKDKLAAGSGVDLAANAVTVQGVKVVAAQVEGADSGALRNAVDQLKSKLGSAVIVLASVDARGKVLLVAGVTADQIGRIKAGELLGIVAAMVGGKGGGRADFAQAGGSDAATLPQALAGVEELVRKRLAA